MAENQADKAKQELDEESQAPKGKMRGRMIVGGAIVGVMLAEALVIVVLIKSFDGAGPQAAEAGTTAGLDADAGLKAASAVEVELVKFRAQNEKSQRVLIYDVSLFAVVSSDAEEEFTELMERRRETVRDRFTRVVRASDPAWFQEPDLATLREQFKQELAEIVGRDDMVQEVLIPSIISYTDG